MAKVLMIGHATGDEKGGASGGAAGDQTGREVCIQKWYSSGSGWNFVLRPKSPIIAEKMAAACEWICASNLVGYDQSQRNTLYNELEKLNWDYKKLTTKCETDCSAFMGTCAKIAGSNVQRVYGNCCYTGNQVDLFMKTGDFIKLTDPKYLNQSTYLQRGDVLVRHNPITNGGHTAMVLGWKEDGVITPISTINNGSLTKTQIKAMQAYYNTTADGQWGPNSTKAAGGLGADEAWKKYSAAVPGDIDFGTGYICRKIPLSKIEKIQYYTNTSKTKTLDIIMQETGADYGINGVLYDMRTWKPCENIKANGVIIASQPAWSNEGFYWTTGADIKWGYVPLEAGKAENYIPGNGLITNLNYKLAVNWNAELSGNRGRTLVGLDNANNVVIYQSLDGTAAALTPIKARDKMVQLNCVKGALNLDGGSSVGWYDKAHHLYNKPGKGTVQNYILFYFKGNNSIDTSPSTKPSQNSNPYPVPARTLNKGSKGEDVKYVQYILYKMGYGKGTLSSFVDGDFGSNTETSVKMFQKSAGLKQDGIVGVRTLSQLQKWKG